jgi:proteasome accessory factor A
MHLFGIETEYGITREDKAEIDVVVESMELVRAYASDPFKQSWDYTGENPHQDQRGFAVSELQQDVEEQEFAKFDAHRPFSFYEMKSDLVLSNGARLYNDHTHPEYSTPECRSLHDIVAHDRAGERIMQEAANQRNNILGENCLQLYKNNTDFHGHSYGCHDNYLISRSIPFERLIAGLLPFLTSRQIIAGAGKIGLEAQDREYQPGLFQLSQRADFMETEMSVDTMHNRPILNTRDEPHANREKYRRLHLIVGDANMCEYTTALKVGTTQLMLELIEKQLAPSIELENPVEAIKILSRDHELKATVKCASGTMITGLELQEMYLEAAQTHLSSADSDTTWVLKEWAQVLQSLPNSRIELVGKIDWVTKHWLLESFVESEQLDWTDPWLASLDLEYHNLHPDRGLYLGLEAEGRITRLCQDWEIEAAIHNGPIDTRGGLRGLCVQRFRKDIESVQWERIEFRHNETKHLLDMSDLFQPEEVHKLRTRIQNVPSASALLAS